MTRGATEASDPIIEVEDLSVSYPTERGTIDALDGVSFTIGADGAYGLVGESGAGKSTVGLAMLGMLPPGGRVEAGSIWYDGRNLLEQSEADWEDVRGGDITMIFQDPSEALNPVLTVGTQLRRVVRHNRGADLSKDEVQAEVVAAMRRVQIPDPESRLDDYPVQFSGGMSQRVMIAMALLCEPNVLIADEPTTNLDVTIGARVLELLDDIRREEDLAILYITHNMGVVAHHCERTGILYAGKLVENGPVRDVFASPKHPYTRDLLECVPRPEQTEPTTIEGSMPTPMDLPDMCYYANRCSMAREACTNGHPPLTAVEGNPDHQSACYFSEEVQ